MTVQELMEILETCPPEHLVCVVYTGKDGITVLDGVAEVSENGGIIQLEADDWNQEYRGEKE